VDCPAAHTDRHGATVGREAGNIGRRGGTRGRCRRRAAERPPRCPLRTSSSAPSVPTAGMTLRLPGTLLRNCWAALRAAKRWRSPRAWGLAPQADRSHARCSGGVSRRPRHAHAPVAAPARNRVGDGSRRPARTAFRRGGGALPGLRRRGVVRRARRRCACGRGLRLSAHHPTCHQPRRRRVDDGTPRRDPGPDSPTARPPNGLALAASIRTTSGATYKRRSRRSTEPQSLALRARPLVAGHSMPL